MQDPELESVTFRIANLELTVTARVLPNPTASDRRVTVSASSTPEGGVVFSDPYCISERLENQAIAASNAAACANLSLRSLSHLTSRLRGSDSEWSPAARTGRAFRAGVIARRQLDGLIQEGVSPGIPFRNSIYIVLRDREHGAAFWTCSYAVYARAVFEPETGTRFASGTISHAFASQAEAEAYCAGALAQWPQERRQ